MAPRGPDLDVGWRFDDRMKGGEGSRAARRGEYSRCICRNVSVRETDEPTRPRYFRGGSFGASVPSTATTSGLYPRSQGGWVTAHKVYLVEIDYRSPKVSGESPI